MNRHFLPIILSFALPICVVACGCGGSDGPKLEPVEGTIMFQGQGLAGAIVEFVPEKGGDTSAGRTDAQGHYKLFRSGDQQGAKAGDYIVRIRVPAPGDNEPAGSAKVIPPQYNSKSTLKATVKEGEENRFNFDLK